MPVGINLKDIDGRFVLINKKFEEWYGKPEKGILGRLTEEIIGEPSAVIDARMKQHRAVVEQRKVVSRQEKKKRADGTVHVMEITKFPIIDVDGKAPLVGTVAVDITELKRAEEEIRKLSSVVEQSPTGMIITDTKGTIEYVNDAFTQMTGYAAKEAIGKNPRILKSGQTPSNVYERMWATIAAGKGWHGTFHNRSKNGTLFLAGATIFPIMTEDGHISHFVGTHQDITQRVAEQNLLKQAEKMESLGNLAGGIAHDFNNMLLPILALTKMTIKRLPNSSEHRERLEKVIQAAIRAKDLVGKILTFSRQEEAKQAPIDVGEVIDETLGLLRTTLPSTVTIEERRSLDGAKVFADATQIGTALMNLMTNAADAMEGRPGTLRVSLTRAEIGLDDAESPKNAKPGAYAKIRVKDTGHGMDQNTMRRIFEPFFTTKEVGKGTGLGLATVYGIVTKHGGFIDVASEIGKGTTFDIYLPVMDEQAGGSNRAGKEEILQSVD
ncbi:MAG: PAS domain S-box protein [Rhodospirillales bacterium]|nr:PAS domain S-box protein [Rhodospirillales bacterium]